MCNPWVSSACTVVLRRISQPTSKYNYCVLLQQRGNTSRSGMYTFPGGVHATSDTSMKTTALRELFEETGVLMSNCTLENMLTPNDIRKWRNALSRDANQFQNMLDQLQCTLRESSLRHFCTFTTPNFEKRRYRTVFFIVDASGHDCSSMLADGVETASLLWVDPSEALTQCAHKEMPMLPPQFYVLNELSAHTCIEDVMATVRATDSESDFSPGDIHKLVDGRGYPELKPSRLNDNSTDSAVVLTLPFDEAHPEYPGSVGKRHRILCEPPIGSGSYSLEKSVGLLTTDST